MEREVETMDPGAQADAMRAPAGEALAEESGPGLFLVHLAPQSPNQEQTLLLAEALREEHWGVHIICPGSCALARVAGDRGLAVHTVPDGACKGFFAAWKVMRIIRKQCRKGGRQEGSRALVHACDVPASHLVSQVWRLDKKLRIAHTRRVPIMEQQSKSIR